MGGTRSIHFLGLISVAAMLLVGAGTAGAATTIDANAECCTFAAGPFVQGLGEDPTFVNPAEGSAPHNVMATENGPDGAPLFESDVIDPGASAPVDGARYLTPGTYPFICIVHPSMTGQLVVDNTGTAVPRPAVALSFPAQKLKQIRKSGKIKIKVKATSESPGISFSLLKGKAKISGATKLNLSAGTSKTISVKLNQAGRKAVKKVKKGKKFQVTASATVPFGKPQKGTRAFK